MCKLKQLKSELENAGFVEIRSMGGEIPSEFHHRDGRKMVIDTGILGIFPKIRPVFNIHPKPITHKIENLINDKINLKNIHHKQLILDKRTHDLWVSESGRDTNIPGNTITQYATLHGLLKVTIEEPTIKIKNIII
jgi:hypothetical protein